MKVEDPILNINKQIEKKEFELERLRNSKLKITIVLAICCFTFPYLPMRHGLALVDKYGYWGSVFFGVIVFSLVIPYAFLRVVDKYENEIFKLKRELRKLENWQESE